MKATGIDGADFSFYLFLSLFFNPDLRFFFSFSFLFAHIEGRAAEERVLALSTH